MKASVLWWLYGKEKDPNHVYFFYNRLTICVTRVLSYFEILRFKQYHSGVLESLRLKKARVSRSPSHPVFPSVQRQKLREIILQQQQQKKMAGRQEKGTQDPGAVPHSGPPPHWQPESVGQVFARPPPPYPGSIRSPMVPPLGPRYTVFPKEARGVYPPDVSGMGMRPHGFR